MKHQKTLGIIGGVGPQTTTKVYQSIIDLFRKNKKRYPSIFIYNLPFPFAIEEQAIIKGVNAHKLIPYLIDAAQKLEKSGADFGILPCNTLHAYIHEIRESVKIPFLSILDETITFLKNKKIRKVGILCTTTSAKSGLYDKHFKSTGIESVYPSDNNQLRLSKIIVELISNKRSDSQTKIILSICEDLKSKGVGAILLACTDLQNSHFPTLNIPIIDTTEILINASYRSLQ